MSKCKVENGFIWKLMSTGAVASAGLLLGINSATALSYSAQPISAVVIDAESRQPLEGVNALIVWQLQNSDGGGGPFWIFEEAVTDNQGRVNFPGWGPKAVPWGLGDRAWRLGPDQPAIYLFKSGYPFGEMSNPWESWMLGNRAWTGDVIRSSVWNNKTIELRRFVGTEEQYLNRLSIVAGGLPLQECRWAKFPRFTAALVVERGNRVKSPMTNSLPTMNSLEAQAKNERDCPAPAVVLGPFLK